MSGRTLTEGGAAHDLRGTRVQGLCPHAPGAGAAPLVAVFYTALTPDSRPDPRQSLSPGLARLAKAM